MEWALINFFGFQGGRLFEVGACSKVGGQTNKYGIYLAKPKSGAPQFLFNYSISIHASLLIV